MSKTGALATGAIVLALAAGGAAHAANLVVDPEFNSPSGGATFIDEADGTSFGGWTVTSGTVDLIGAYWQAPEAGGGSVDLDGISAGAITQTLATGTGEYTLSFDLSGNPDGPPQVKSLAVLVGNVVKTFTYTIGGNTHANMMYTPETFTFNASGPTTLTFASLDQASSPFGPVIGDINVSAVPEPASWALMLLGLGAMGGALRSSRLRTSQIRA
ncbi:MAG TPA: PEPxxWA-CTERM sorting domain-containing protein [Caulobacteraceae bacterium]|jgi:choice-of-anchor C domain-containing protein